MFYQTDLGDHGLPHNPFKALVAPRPIGWITAMDKAGNINLSPYSYFNAVCDAPPMVVFSSSGWKHAVAFVEETGEFVCNLVSFELREAMNVTSAPFAHGVNEMEKAGLAAAPSRLVRPPRVAASPAALECKWVQTVPLKTVDGVATDHFLVIGQVVGVYIDERFIQDGLVDTAAMRLIQRSGYHDYFEAREEGRFTMKRPTTV